MEKTFYEKFGIKETATLDEIKRAYRKLAFRYHPDKNDEDKKFENIFKQINNIYETLSNSEQRIQYDAELKKKRAKNKQYSFGNYTSQQQTYNYKRPSGNTTSNEGKAAYKYERYLTKKYSGTAIIATVIIIFLFFFFLINSSDKSSVAKSSNSVSSQSTGEINFGSSNSQMHSASDTTTLATPNAKAKCETK